MSLKNKSRKLNENTAKFKTTGPHCQRSFFCVMWRGCFRPQELFECRGSQSDHKQDTYSITNISRPHLQGKF